MCTYECGLARIVSHEFDAKKLKIITTSMDTEYFSFLITATVRPVNASTITAGKSIPGTNVIISVLNIRYPPSTSNSPASAADLRTPEKLSGSARPVRLIASS